MMVTRLALLVAAVLAWAPVATRAEGGRASASSEREGSHAAGAIDGDRLAFDGPHAWRGKPGETSWWWQCEWNEPREVGAILQVAGDDPLVLQNAPLRYVWQGSL